LVEVLQTAGQRLQIYTGSKVTEADWNGSQMLEVTVADTGRGIEPNRLEVVFDRFYQEEGALRRTTVAPV